MLVVLAVVLPNQNSRSWSYIIYCYCVDLQNQPLECNPTDISKCLTDADFEEGMKYVDCNNEVKIEEITELEQEWKDAFILGANKIYDKTSESGWQFLRGDKNCR